MDLARLLATGDVPEIQNRNGLWVSGFNQWGDQEEKSGFSSYDYRIGGGAIGFDYTFPSRVMSL
jgi:outer membrane autotransporter protein